MLTRLTRCVAAVVAGGLVLQAAACSDLAALYGLGGGATANPNTQDEPTDQGTSRLTSITFSPASGFPQGADPASFDVGGASLTFAGGSAGTLGRTGLYADDAFAWDFLPGATGSIDLAGLEVVAVDGYWVQPAGQAGTATMMVGFSDGTAAEVLAAAVDASGALGQSAGFFDTVGAPEGATIVSITFEFSDDAENGDVAALDVLELSVRE